MKKAIKIFIYTLLLCVLISLVYTVMESKGYTVKIIQKVNADVSTDVSTIDDDIVDNDTVDNNINTTSETTQENKNIDRNNIIVGNNVINNLKLIVNKQDKDVNNIDLFNYVIERIKTSYVEDVDDNEIYESALKGILSSLDPHSMYMTQKEFKEMQVQTKGEFGGLGIVVAKDGNFIKVISPIDDTPAAKAGILAGDYISEIDGVDTFDMNLVDAVEKMRGKVGERIKIVVLRVGETAPLTFNLKREMIKIDAVKGSVKHDDIIYLRITNFIETTQQDTINMYNSLKNQIKSGVVKGVVLDLRNNPGGLLDQSVKISELFLDGNKTVISIRGKNNQFFEDYKTSNKKPLIKDIPIVVLVNEGSASASEIVAGALQDHKVGIVVGEKTFGKASVQQVFPLLNGGAVKMTIARYYTPLGRSIQVDGIIPDIIVKQGKITFNNKTTPEVREKDLKGHLEKQDDIVKTTLLTRVKEAEKKENNFSQEDLNDYQLLKALDLINGINFFKNKNE